jgi:hypothetical protein
MTIWSVACWISKATRAKSHARACAPTPMPARSDTHTHTHINMVKCVTLIAFALQHLLRKRTSLLHYTYIASLIRI